MKEKFPNLGGIDETDLSFDNRPSEPASYDKFHHAARSVANQPNHVNHWNKRLIVGGNNPDTRGRINFCWFISHLPVIRSRNNKND